MKQATFKNPLANVKVGSIVSVETVRSHTVYKIVVNRIDYEYIVWGTVTLNGEKYCATLSDERTEHTHPLGYAFLTVYRQPDPNGTFIGGECEPKLGGPDFGTLAKFNYKNFVKSDADIVSVLPPA